MMNNSKKFKKGIESIGRAALVALSISLLILTDISIVMRKFFTAITWSIEISVLIYMWLVCLGIFLALRHNEHVGMTFVLDKIKQKNYQSYKILTIVGRIIGIMFFGIIFIYATKQTYSYLGNKVICSTLNFPRFVFPLALVFTSILCCAWLICKLNRER